jgi:OOP family OmpA-OmpF porin
MIVSVVFSVYAENKSGATSISLNGGYYSFEGNQDYKDNFTGGLRIGYNFTENWGTELFFYYVPSKYNLNDADNNFYFTGIEGLYHFMPENRFVPFLALGIGATHYSSDDTRLVPSKFAIDYGAGFKFFISDNIAFRADVRHVLPLGDSEKYGHNPDFIHNDLLATVGILFTAGWKEKVVDSDRDGVLDDVDKCPDTPLGVKVDKDGCPIDSDNDGVPDYLDKCPGTPVGCTVDKDGCPIDSDKDGVIDCRDKCPGTPAGVVVDKDGCPLDSDKDGVPDYLDKCPGTPVGCTVDKDGCPIDSDKDGVIDCRDKCPNTPEGCAVNKDGCPLDSDNDGVIDCRDKCPNTPAGAKVDKDGCSREKISISLNVQFDTAKADIKGKYHNNIKRVADFMKMYPNTSAIIEGHTDTVGKEAYNIRLSKARADSVKQYLVDKFGIDASSIETIGYGPKKPVADNSTPEGKQKNRRVDAVLETMLVR